MEGAFSGMLPNCKPSYINGVSRFPLANKGTITIDYNWQVIMDNFVSPGPRSVTFAQGEEPRPGTANALAVRPASGE